MIAGMNLKKKCTSNIDDKKVNDYSRLISTIKDKMKMVYWMINKKVAKHNFSSLQELVDEIGNNDILKCFGHTSNDGFMEFTKAMNRAAVEYLSVEIKRFKYYSLIIDDGQNTNRKNMVSIYIRFINSQFEPTARFLSMREIGEKGATSENLFSIIICVMDEWNISLQYMIAFTSDGASNMKGLYKLLLQKSPDAVWIHCSSHRINLSLKDSLKNILLEEMVNSKHTLYEMVRFVNSSSNRISSFENIQKKIYVSRPHKLLQDCDVRWSSFYNSVHSVVNSMEAVQIYFETMSENEECEFIKKLNGTVYNLNFLGNIATFEVVLGQVNIAIKSLQEYNIDIGKVVFIIEKLKEKLIEVKESDGVHNKVKGFVPKLNDDGDIMKKEKLVVKDLCSKYVNSIISCINSRFENDMISDLVYIFSPDILNNLTEDGWQLLRKKYVSLVDHFKYRFKEQRFDEKNEDLRIYKEELKKVIKKKKTFKDVCLFVLLSHKFKDIITLVRLALFALIIPPTSVPVECGFSTLSNSMPKKCNRIGEMFLNLLLMFQINFNKIDKMMEEIISKGVVEWISGQKKRRGLEYVMMLLDKSKYKEEIVTDSRTSKKIINEEYCGDEKSDEFIYSSLCSLDEADQQGREGMESECGINEREKEIEGMEYREEKENFCFKQKRKRKMKKKENNSDDDGGTKGL
jgi:hypothetical protein